MSYNAISIESLQEKIRKREFVGLQKLQELSALKKLVEIADEDSKRISAEHAYSVKKREFDELHDEVKKLQEQRDSLQASKVIPLNSTTPSFTPLSFHDLLQLPPKEWLLNQVFGKGDIGAIYGPPGCGKTFVVIDMIMSVCTANPWAARFDVLKPLNVAYCAGEGFGGLPSRFQAAASHYGVNNLSNFTFFKSTPQLYNETDDHSKSILQFCMEWQKRQQAGEAELLDLLIIDTLHTASEGADENSSKEMGLILKACKQAIEMLGCAIILVHHTTKSGETERGSSSLRGAMDFMLRISRQDKEHDSNASLICSKLKDGEQWQPQGFHLAKKELADNVHVKWNDPSSSEEICKPSKNSDKSKILSIMRQNPNVGFTATTIGEAIGHGRQYANQLLSELVESATCSRNLKDPGKDKSSNNPWIFNVKY